VTKRRRRDASDRLRSLLVLAGIFGATGLACSLAVHNMHGAWGCGIYLAVIAVVGPVLIWRDKL
jgi:hypothetical protein